MSTDFHQEFNVLSEKVIGAGKMPEGFSLKENIQNPFLNPSFIASRLEYSMMKSIENLDEEYQKFEKKFVNSHNAVFWASDYNDVFSNLKYLFKAQKAKSVRLPNVNASTIFRELGIKYFLHEEKINLSEEGAIQFFPVDMLFSDNGSILLLNQSVNSYQFLSNSKTNVFFATINQIICNSDWAEIIQQIVSYRNNAGRQDMILFNGSSNCNNYLFIIDNQRTSILQHKELRPALTCLSCGRCNDVCPVYQTIGDEPYNNVFTGPIAHISLPYLETVETYKHLTYACTLCGRCEEVCPISLPIRDMIIWSRQKFVNDGSIDKNQRRMISVLKKNLLNRGKLNRSKFLRRHLFYKYMSSEISRSRRMPVLANDTFNKDYKIKTES
ncbi:MAG: lactate utilization protein [Bacteroidales bacterium]|nr:lactate utilization protein [Bacteroidales bacterium]